MASVENPSDSVGSPGVEHVPHKQEAVGSNPIGAGLSYVYLSILSRESLIRVPHVFLNKNVLSCAA